MDETNNSGEQNEDNNNSCIKLLRECLLLLDQYNNCLSVMSDKCKCEQNSENKLIFNDLLLKYKTFIENINTLALDYRKIAHLFDDLSEHTNTEDNQTISNECVEQNIEENENMSRIDDNVTENDGNIDAIDGNSNANDVNETEENKTLNEQNIDTNLLCNENFEYISKNYIDNKIDSIIKENTEKRRKNAAIKMRSKKLKLKLKSTKTQTNATKTKSVKVESKTDSTSKRLQMDKCWICEIDFHKRSEYLNHLKHHHSKPPLKCEKLNSNGDVCGRVYRVWKNLNRHVRVAHNNINKNVIKPELIEPVLISSEVFECELCLQFINVNDRDSHYKSMHKQINDTTSYDKCLVCEIEFNKRSEFIAHNKQHHAKRPFTCNKLVNDKDCGKFYSQLKDLIKHIKKEHIRARPFKCSQCDKQFAVLKKLIIHRKKYHSAEKYVCDWKDCEYTTHINYLLSRHLKRHLNPKPRVRKAMKSEDEKKIFKCPDCDKVYYVLASYNSHVNYMHRQHKFVCEFEGCQFTTSTTRSIKLHRNRHLNVKLFQCDWPGCDSSFVDKWNLLKHSTRHSDGQFNCPHCDQAFKTNKSMKVHIMTAHTECEKKYECDQCQRKYVTKSQLYDHVRRIHSEKHFQCDSCEYRSYSKAHLATHNRRVHLRERTYICEVPGCEGKRFFESKDLKCHQISAHSDERKYVCDWPECGAAFKIKGNLTVHIKCHTGNNTPRKRVNKS